MTTQIIKSLRSQVFIPPSLQEMEHIATRMRHFTQLKQARSAFQRAWSFARKTGLGAEYIAAARPYILGKYWKAVTGISGGYKGKVWAEEVFKTLSTHYARFTRAPLTTTVGVRQGLRTPLLVSESILGKRVISLKSVAGAAAASRAAAQAGATGAAKGVTNRVMRNRLLKRIAQGTFKFAQTKTGAFTAAVLGGLIALTIAGASYVRRNPSEVALAQLRQRRATHYPRAPSGLVFALHATR